MLVNRTEEKPIVAHLSQLDLPAHQITSLSAPQCALNGLSTSNVIRPNHTTVQGSEMPLDKKAKSSRI